MHRGSFSTPVTFLEANRLQQKSNSRIKRRQRRAFHRAFWDMPWKVFFTLIKLLLFSIPFIVMHALLIVACYLMVPEVEVRKVIIAHTATFFVNYGGCCLAFRIGSPVFRLTNRLILLDPLDINYLHSNVWPDNVWDAKVPSRGQVAENFCILKMWWSLLSRKAPIYITGVNDKRLSWSWTHNNNRLCICIDVNLTK